MRRDRVDEIILNIYREALHDATLEETDNFFDKGGNSLTAAKICRLIRKEMNVSIAITDVFKYPNVVMLSEKLRQGRVEKSQQELLSFQHDGAGRYDKFPLTKIQQGYVIGRESGENSSHFYLELKREKLDVERFEKVINFLISDNDALRIVIEPNKQEQRVLKEVPHYKVRYTDLTKEKEEEGAYQTIRAEMEKQVLDVYQWPIFDIRVTKTAKMGYILHFSFDNVILDGFSILSLLNEIEMRYQTENFDPKIQNNFFRDYVCAYEAIHSTKQYMASKSYWENKMHEMPSAPALPTLKKRKYGGFYRLQGMLEFTQWEKVKQKAQENAITPSAVLLTAFSEVLYRWNRYREFTLNLTVHNKEVFEASFEQVIGDFTSLSLLTVAMGKQSSFCEKCREVQESLSVALENRYYDGIDVQRELARKYSNGKQALFPIVFTSMLGVVEDVKLPGERVYGMTQTPNVWLDHQMWEINGEFLYNWDILEGMYKKEMIEEMFEAYQILLLKLAEDEQIWNEPRKSFVELPNIKKRYSCNQTKEYKKEDTLLSMFLHSYQTNKYEVAVVADGKSYTYEECMRLAAELAKRLPEEPLIAVKMEKGIWQVIAVLAILLKGSAYVPIDSKNPKERVQRILQNAGIKTILTEEDMICGKADIRDTERLVEKALEKKERNKLAYVIYTSGSTGEPKGVMVTHAAAVNTIWDINDKFGVSNSDHGLALSNLAFDLSVYDIFGMLAAGGTIVTPREEKVRDPEEWVRLVEENKVTVWNSVPQFMEMLLLYMEINKVEPKRISSIRLVLLSGDKIENHLPERIRNMIPGVRVICMGGATEAAIWSNYYEPAVIEEDWNSIPYGYPLANQQYFVLNQEFLECPNYVDGELCIGGAGLALGYINDEEMTKSKFMTMDEYGGKIYRTGDRGKYDKDGKILFLGREDKQVKIQGYRVELGEVEAALMKVADVKDAKVIVQGDELVAFIIWKNAKQKDSSKLKLSLKEKLPHYYIPRCFYMLEKFPVTGNGKVDEKALRFMSEELNSENDKNEMLKTDTEQTVSVIWKKHLGKIVLGREEDFFQCGGNSIKAIETVGEINEQFPGIAIEISELYANSTIAELAELIDKRKKEKVKTECFEEGVI